MFKFYELITKIKLIDSKFKNELDVDIFLKCFGYRRQ